MGKKNLPFNDAYFIDWNTGENSPLDMFLMSQCKYAIIANSTFSYWGAMLGRKGVGLLSYKVDKLGIQESSYISRRLENLLRKFMVLVKKKENLILNYFVL